MRELKILTVVVVFSLITYWGVEPFAHSQMHKHLESGNYEYKDLPNVDKGNPTNGEALVTTHCIACHSINAKNLKAPLDAIAASGAYGVNPPDLSTSGAIYDAKYLAAFIKNPANASKLSHKYSDGTKSHPMPGYSWMSESDIADMVAFLQSIASQELTNKEVFIDACGRCHAVRYDNRVLGEKWTQIGQKVKYKFEKDSLLFDIQVLEYQENLKKYMGILPPDLSTIIRARSENYLETFIENPQVQLPGTAMPAVGLNKKSYEQVMAYLTEVGDPSKKDREAYGPWFLLYMLVFIILAVLWKKEVWKSLK